MASDDFPELPHPGISMEDLIADTPSLFDDSAEEIVLSGPYNVFCNKCRQHHPEAWTCAFWVQLNRIDEERRN